MRKILIFTRNGIAQPTAASGLLRLVAIGASLAVTFCCSSNAPAQSNRELIMPAASTDYQNAPVSRSYAPSAGQPSSTRDASYSIMSDTTHTEPATFVGARRAAASRLSPVRSACDTGCDVTWYSNYEALWLRRENDERFSLSRNTFLPDFDYELGGRITIGHLSDCVNGWEAVYAGPFDWERTATVVGGGNLQSQFATLGGYTGAQVSAFNNADQHTQAYRAQLHNFEVNRRWWTWDVLSTMIGIRYVDYEEDYLFFSRHATVGDGLFRESVDNQMIGAQVGADMLYPVSLRTNVGFRGKAGVYANFDERETLLVNAGSVVLNAGDSQVEVAGLIEGGVFATYHVVPSIRLTAGYEFWYLPGIASVPEQSPSRLSPSSGTTVFHEDDLFLHGGSAGVQILF